LVPFDSQDRRLSESRSASYQNSHPIEPPLQSGCISNAETGVPTEAQALKVLQRLVGKDDATWRCDVQRQGVMAMLELERDVIAIMATSSGKTMLAIIPPLLEPNSITVIILPFRSLMADYTRKLDNMKVPFKVYMGVPLHGQANIILVSTDMTHIHSWREHINILNLKRPVVRQVYDECHEPLTGQDYRQSMRNVYVLRDILKGQFAGLTGTLTKPKPMIFLTSFSLVLILLSSEPSQTGQSINTSGACTTSQYLPQSWPRKSKPYLKSTQSLIPRTAL